MSLAAEPALVRRPRPRALARSWAFVRHHALSAYGVLALAYLMLPIVIVALFSFNNPSGKYNYLWEGFTLESWKDPFGVPGLGDAMTASLKIAGIATVISTVLGTLAALALVRYQFRGRGATNFLIFLPMAAPEIVLGSSLLTLFLNLSVVLGLWTIVTRAHHVLRQLRHRDCQVASDRLRPSSRGGRNGPLRDAVGRPFGG